MTQQGTDNCLRAFFDFDDVETGIHYVNFSLNEGHSENWWVEGTSMPYQEKNGSKKYRQMVRVIYGEAGRSSAGEGWFNELCRVALASYKERIGGKAAKATKASANTASAKYNINVDLDDPPF